MDNLWPSVFLCVVVLEGICLEKRGFALYGSRLFVGFVVGYIFVNSLCGWLGMTSAYVSFVPLSPIVVYGLFKDKPRLLIWVQISATAVVMALFLNHAQRMFPFEHMGTFVPAEMCIGICTGVLCYGFCPLRHREWLRLVILSALWYGILQGMTHGDQETIAHTVLVFWMMVTTGALLHLIEHVVVKRRSTHSMPDSHSSS